MKLKRYLRANPYAMNRKKARSHLLTDTPWKVSFLHSTMHGFNTQQLNSIICQSHFRQAIYTLSIASCQSHFRQAIYTLSIAANHTSDKLLHTIHSCQSHLRQANPAYLHTISSYANEAAVDGL